MVSKGAHRVEGSRYSLRDLLTHMKSRMPKPLKLEKTVDKWTEAEHRRRHWRVSMPHP